MVEKWNFVYFKPSGKFYTAEREVLMDAAAFDKWHLKGHAAFFAAIADLKGDSERTLPGLNGRHTDLALVVMCPEESNFGWPLLFPAGKLTEEVLGEW